MGVRCGDCTISRLSRWERTTWVGVGWNVGTRKEERNGRTRVPNLRLNPLIVNRDRAGGKLNADCRPTLDTEVIADKPREHYSPYE